ncbi:PIN domain-containing protein [Brevundimonas sp. NIBR11]|uniref:type II toxin-antitoxin system VapC family toxin n=1 Tax=Brevundimonas sp. NIBR11 TaxID=3015999 RepID=UPI0022F1066B|nr:PIN domain-containing protein [Brevundimonas sp. NIBR11]
MDTQIVVWIFNGSGHRLSKRAAAAISRSPSLCISPLVAMEIDMLIERGRVDAPDLDAVISEIAESFGPVIQSQASLSDIVAKSLTIGWTRDPFDRLIVANAMADRTKLVTSDEKIRAHFKDAVWD